MSLLVKIIIFIMVFYIYASVIIFFYAIYKGRNLDRKPIFGAKVFNAYFFGIGCLIGLTAFFAAGFERALFFIPESWGRLDEDGDWQSIKEYLSYIFGFLASIGILDKANKIFYRGEKK